MGTRRERYQIIHTIAASEVKTIWFVYHPIEQVYYIMKRLPAQTNTKLYEQMKIHPHPYIPSIHETFLQEGYFYVVESFINGPTLGYVMSSHPLGEETAVRYIGQLCEALDHLHHLNPPLIHRDIKAENILIVDQHIMLIDFEIARQFSETANKDTQVLGSVGYAAPEQYGFNQSDERTDIYAVGVLMNYLLCGRHPKDGIASGRYEKIIQKCIAIDPKDRYQHVSLLSQALYKRPNDELKPKRSYALPGFRGQNPAVWAVSALLYIGLVFLCMNVTVTGKHITPSYLTTVRISVFIIWMVWVLILGNYLGFQDHLPFQKDSQKLLKYAVIIGICLLSAVFVILVSTIVYNIYQSLL